MAREPSAQNDDESPFSSAESDERTGNSELLGRRSYLKLAGAATAGVAATLASTAAAASEYETITLNAGQHRTFRVGSGETFENVLIDQSASGASSTIVVEGGDVRNVMIEGRNDNVSSA